MRKSKDELSLIEKNTFFMVGFIMMMKKLKLKEIKVSAEDIAKCIKNRTKFTVEEHTPYEGVKPDGGVTFAFEEQIEIKKDKKPVTKKD